MSAGLGLVAADDPVPAYDATFTQHDPDSVCAGEPRATAARRRWWAELAEWQGPAGRKGPSRLADLAATPYSRILVCVGPDYLDAAADDLRAARREVGDDRLVIMASGEPIEGLSDVWVRCPGRLRVRLGGSMVSTGVRAAKGVIESLAHAEDLNAFRARQVIGDWTRLAAPLPTYQRSRLTDDAVLDWIRTDLRAHPESATWSSALRRLRDQGYACEQRRFAGLFDGHTGSAG
jgi:hypothetical protein